MTDTRDSLCPQCAKADCTCQSDWANGINALTAAQEAIEREDQVCFDVCAEHGQIFGNVKGTRWLAEAVAEALQE